MCLNYVLSPGLPDKMNLRLTQLFNPSHTKEQKQPTEMLAVLLILCKNISNRTHEVVLIPVVFFIFVEVVANSHSPPLHLD